MPEDSSSCCAGGFYLLCNSTRLSAASYIQNMRLLCVCSNKSAFTASLNVEKPRVTLRRSHALLSRNLIIPRWRAGHRRLPIFKIGRGCSARMCGGIQRRLEEVKDLVSLRRVRVEPATLSDHWRVTEVSHEVCVACVKRRIVSGNAVPQRRNDLLPGPTTEKVLCIMPENQRI